MLLSKIFKPIEASVISYVSDEQSCVRILHASSEAEPWDLGSTDALEGT